MKKTFGLLALTLAFACSRTETPQQTASAAPQAGMPAMQMPSHSMEPATDTAAPDAPILAVSQLYNASAREAYMKAAEVPDRLDKMYCYCHCHQHMQHRSLKTCFQTHHAEECNVCQKEALIAWQDWKDGRSAADSQLAADQAFNMGNPPPSS